MSKANVRIRDIEKAVKNRKYTDLGKTELIDEYTLENIKISVVPNEGFHEHIEYIITIKFQEEGNWPLVYIDSELYDKIKTNQYLQGKGSVGQHKGICIKNLSYGYSFIKWFNILCCNKWENYIYYLIVTFNNFQDFEKGNGIKSNYKNILGI
jgi:hypothetical protein